MTMSEPSESLRPMTIGDILHRSIQLYRNNFLKFIGIVLLVKGTYLILGYILKELIAFFFAGSGEGAAEMAIYMDYAIGPSLKVLELLFVTPILIAAMTMAISGRFLNRDVGVTEAYRRILKRLLPLLGTVLLRGVIISAVFLACAFLGLFMLLAGSQPGLIIMIGGILAGVLLVWYAFIPQTVVIEGEGGISAMKRSKYLVKGYFIKAFVLIILIFVAAVLVTETTSLGIFYLLGRYGSFSADGASEGASNVISVLLEPFIIAIVTLLYYDFRVRKEGFDLEIMAEELEAV
jgi:hypothetical protein